MRRSPWVEDRMQWGSLVLGALLLLCCASAPDTPPSGETVEDAVDVEDTDQRAEDEIDADDAGDALMEDDVDPEDVSDEPEAVSDDDLGDASRDDAEVVSGDDAEDADAEDAPDAPQEDDAEPPTVAARYLALGDSYTIGERVAVEERWPVQLVEALRGEGAAFVEGVPEIVARTGWTTTQLDTAMDAAEMEGPYEMVSLLIGVNNQFQGRDLDEFRDEFAGLLARAIALAGGEPQRVFVLSIPDWGATPFASRRDRAQIAREIDQFNAAKMEVCAASAVAFVDITPISRRAPEEPELVADDGLHPSGVMYAAFVVEALPFAREILAIPSAD